MHKKLKTKKSTCIIAETCHSNTQHAVKFHLAATQAIVCINEPQKVCELAQTLITKLDMCSMPMGGYMFHSACVDTSTCCSNAYVCLRPIRCEVFLSCIRKKNRKAHASLPARIVATIVASSFVICCYMFYSACTRNKTEKHMHQHKHPPQQQSMHTQFHLTMTRFKAHA